MQYPTVFLAATAALLSTTGAFPGHRAGHKHHHLHRRAPEPIAQPEAQWDLSKVDWSAAMAKVDWSNVNYGSGKTNNNAPAAAAAANVVAVTTTVAVVGTAAPVAVRPVVATQAGNVAAAVTPAAVASTPSTSSSSSSNNNMTPGNNDYTVQVVNSCPYQIWQAGWQTNTAGGILPAAAKGNALAAGSSITLAIPKSALGVQLWARTGCSGSGSSFHCDVGDCQGFQCSSIIWQKGPIMAEFGSGLNTDMYNTGITAYDISAIPGNNVGCKIVPSISSCETKYCPLTGCDNTQAWHFDSDMNLGSPADTVCSNAANFVVTFCP